MQTFLPFAPDKTKDGYSFRNSAAVLDPRRLNKQCLEGYQILKLLLNPSPTGGWRNHPAVLQWKGHEGALCQYVLDMCQEHIDRGGETKVIDLVKALPVGGKCKDLPKWMGDKAFHSSHRSRLLFKGSVDALLETLRLDLGISRPHKWLLENKFPKANLLHYNDVLNIEDCIYTLNADLNTFRPNYYSQFKWEESEDDCVEYVWPVKKDK